MAVDEKLCAAALTGALELLFGASAPSQVDPDFMKSKGPKLWDALSKAFMARSSLFDLWLLASGRWPFSWSK